MLTIKRYVRAQSLDEAYTLCQKRANVVLGGMLWLKTQNRTVDTAIDLCDLGLSNIEETPDAFRIGAMVTLRELEQHPGLAALTGALWPKVCVPSWACSSAIWPPWGAAFMAGSAFRMC